MDKLLVQVEAVMDLYSETGLCASSVHVTLKFDLIQDLILICFPLGKVS